MATCYFAVQSVQFLRKQFQGVHEAVVVNDTQTVFYVDCHVSNVTAVTQSLTLSRLSPAALVVAILLSRL